jgi:hypothetical protein
MSFADAGKTIDWSGVECLCYIAMNSSKANLVVLLIDLFVCPGGCMSETGRSQEGGI